MHRAYGLKQHANAGKQSKAIETVREYRKTAEKIARVQWRFFYGTGGGFDKHLAIKHIASFLSERYKQTCQYQVVGILASFLSNRQNDFVDLVKRSSLEENTRHKLLVINAWSLWQRTAPFTSLQHKLQIDAADLLLARKLFKDVLHRHRRPSFRKINMALDNKVAVITSKVPDKAKAFDYWIRLSPLDKGVPSSLPLSTNGYFESTPGRRRNFCQVNRSEDSKIAVTFIKDVLKKAYVPEIPKIALDLGLTTLFATNRGDLTGRRFFEVLQQYDLLISELASHRQNHGLKVRSRTYDNLVNKIREFMKNEINRVLNRLVEIHKPAEIVGERLDFRSPNLSRRMNRLISWFGKSYVQRKLKSLTEMLGITLSEGNPAYSSQECSVCGYGDKANRTAQAVFQCKCCNNGIHADVNAARNHLGRSSSGVIDVYKSRETVLRILTERFLSHAERIPRLYSKAQSLLPANPYFRGYPAQLKGFS